jgi:hypothetical protein
VVFEESLSVVNNPKVAATTHAAVRRPLVRSAVMAFPHSKISGFVFASALPWIYIHSPTRRASFTSAAAAS